MLWGGCYDLYGFRWVLAKWFNAKRSLTLHTSTKRKIKKKTNNGTYYYRCHYSDDELISTKLPTNFEIQSATCKHSLHVCYQFVFLIFFVILFSLFFLNTHTVFTYDSQFLTCVALFRFFFPWFSQLGLLCFLHWLFILYFCCIYLFTGCKRRREKKEVD